MVLGLLAQTQDASRADVEAGVTYVRERLEPLIVGACRNNGTSMRESSATNFKFMHFGAFHNMQDGNPWHERSDAYG